MGYPEVLLGQLSRYRREESCQEKKRREGEGKGGKEGGGKGWGEQERRGENTAVSKVDSVLTLPVAWWSASLDLSMWIFFFFALTCDHIVPYNQRNSNHIRGS